MNPFAHIRSQIITALDSLSTEGTLPTDLPTAAITVEPPRDASHGDMATNAAMVLAKPAKMNPRAIAEALKAILETTLPDIETIEIAGPGFINLRFHSSFWQKQLHTILNEGTAYGNSTLGGNEKINVEYVSANPTGPMHIGHARGACIGDALANLLDKAGYNVTREYYINDAGAQIDTLARSAHLRYREALGDKIGDIPKGLYPGDYLIPVGKELAAQYSDAYKDAPESEWLPIFRPFAIERMMQMIRDDLATLGVTHDHFLSEATLVASGLIEECLEKLETLGLIYTGVLEPPKGKKPDDWEPTPQTLFRSTDFGDDIDRALKKSDGSWTYFTPDIACHYDKFRRGHNQMIDVWGADHGGYVKRVQAAVKAITEGKGELDVKLCQMVNLMENGQPFKMSKRAGTFVTLRDMVDAVGKDVVRFIMLTRKNDAQLDFDVKKVKEQSRENPVFYVQYAHARACSVLRNAEEEIKGISTNLAAITQETTTLLNDEAELTLIRRLASWPRTVEAAALSHEPHRIAFYLQEVAADFHALWNLGKEKVDIRFIVTDNANLTQARLALVSATATVIASGLAVMGVTPVESM